MCFVRCYSAATQKKFSTHVQNIIFVQDSFIQLPLTHFPSVHFYNRAINCIHSRLQQNFSLLSKKFSCRSTKQENLIKFKKSIEVVDCCASLTCYNVLLTSVLSPQEFCFDFLLPTTHMLRINHRKFRLQQFMRCSRNDSFSNVFITHLKKPSSEANCWL